MLPHSTTPRAGSSSRTCLWSAPITRTPTAWSPSDLDMSLYALRNSEPMQQEQHDIFSTRQSYDQVAGAYAEKYLHEFDHKPVDRDLLDRFAERVKERGRVLDLGCGPGQVA